MTVQTSTDRADYLGNAATTAFTVPFYFVDPTHLIAYLTVIATGVVTTLILNSDYTITGTGGSSGTLTTTVAPATGTRLSILRNVPLVQLTHYVPNDPFPAASHENALDLLTMIAQQVSEAQARCLSFPPADPASITPQLPAAGARASMLLGFDSLGNVTTVAPVAGTATALATQLAVTNSPSSGAGQLGYGGPGINYPANTVGAALNARIYAVKAAATSRNTTTTLANDPDLVIPLAAVGTYSFEMWVPMWATTTSAMGFKFGVNFSGTATGFYEAHGQAVNTNIIFPTTALGAMGSPPASIVASASQVGADWLRLTGGLTVTAVGSLSLQWAQVASSANNLNVGANAWLKCEKLA